jgi:urease gamma subunit
MCNKSIHSYRLGTAWEGNNTRPVVLLVVAIVQQISDGRAGTSLMSYALNLVLKRNFVNLVPGVI